MAAAMALMASPAIIMAVLFAIALRQERVAGLFSPGAMVAALGGRPTRPSVFVGKVLHESFTDGAQLLLLGAMVVGLVTGEGGKAALPEANLSLYLRLSLSVRFPLDILFGTPACVRLAQVTFGLSAQCGRDRPHHGGWRRRVGLSSGSPAARLCGVPERRDSMVSLRPAGGFYATLAHRPHQPVRRRLT